MRTYALIGMFLRVALNSCVVLESQQYVNTGLQYPVLNSGPPLISLDYKPANILLSGIETGRVTAKVGDLGLGEQALIDERHTPLL